MTAMGPVERIAAAEAGLANPPARGPAWARRRKRAFDTIASRGLPGRGDENWKYLDHSRIAEYPFDVSPTATVDAAALAPRMLPLEHAHRVVLADGRYEPRCSGRDVPAGLEIIDLGVLLERDPQSALAMLRAPGEDADDRFALLADALATGGVLIRVAPGMEIAEPLYLVHLATAAAPAVHQSRVVIEAGSGARFTLVEHFVALGGAAALGNLAAELTLGESSVVTHLRLHEHSPAAAQIETWVARLAGGSRYEQHLLVLGGRLVRSNLRLALEGRDAACRLDGLFLADGDRQVDLHTAITHVGPATETTQDYRGIAAGRGRGAFNGKIVVQPTARGANAIQSSRNLLLTPLAEINARPQLEILVDEVQCRHGATTGTLDPEQLFYLVSRGLDPETARALLTFAFGREVTRRLPLAPVRAAAEMLLAGALPDRELMRELG